MRLASKLGVFSLTFWLVAGVAGPALGQLVTPPKGELMLQAKLKDQEVEAIRRDLDEAEVAASFARARLARAEGNVALAGSEWRKVLRHREAQLERIKRELDLGRYCGADPFKEPAGAVAIARVWLADLEGRTDVLQVELPKAIAYFEWKTQFLQSLLDRHAALSEEVREPLRQLREELGWSKARLAVLRAEPAKSGRPAGP